MTGRMARQTIAVAVRLLPLSMRERYSEQWRADLRDAREAGIRPASIAAGSLAFAFTVRRAAPASVGQKPAHVVARRERLTGALALSAALVSVSAATTAASSGGLTGDDALDLVTFLLTAPLTLYALAAPAASIILAIVTRGMDARVHWATWMLAASVVIAGGHQWGGVVLSGGVVIAPGAILASAIVLLIGGVALLGSRFRTPRSSGPRRPAAGLTGAVIVAGAAALGLVVVMELVARQESAGAAFVTRMVGVDSADAANLAADLASVRVQVVVGVVVWAAVCILLASAVAAAGILGRSDRRRSLTHTIAALSLVVLSHAALSAFVQHMSIGGVGIVASSPEWQLAVVRWALAGIVLATLGGVRLEQRPAAAAV